MYMAIWERFKPGNMGWYTSELALHVFSKLHYADDAVQVLFVFNIGLHEHMEREYANNLHKMFAYAKKVCLQLGKDPSKNKFLYRETSAQHFNLSAGYFDHRAITKWKKINPTGRYQCVASGSTDSSKHDWRLRAETQSLKANPHVLFIPFHNMSRHYHDIHPFAFQRARKSRKKLDFDCTHFEPSAGVILYRFLWHSLLQH